MFTDRTTLFFIGIFAPIFSYAQMDTGMDHSCAIIDQQTVCWGQNKYKQLDAPDGLGRVVDYGLGYYHSCAVDSNLKLHCWGDDYYDQRTLPKDLGPVTLVAAGLTNTCAVTQGQVKCWGKDADKLTRPPRFEKTILDLQLHTIHACVLLSDQTLQCWGHNRFGQTTLPKNLGEVDAFAVGGHHTCALKDEKVTCWGDKRFGKIKVPNDLKGVVEIAAGFDHSCALLESGAIKCWGDSQYNQLNVPDDIKNPRNLRAGWGHSCVQSDDGPRCWGLTPGSLDP